MAADQREGGGEIALRSRLTLPELYDQHYRTMVKLASMYVDDTGTAEEVVQDSFVKLVSGSYRVEDARQVAYLRQMVLNGARSTLRKRKVRRDYNPDDPGTVPSAESAGVASAERDRVLAAIRKLPRNQSNVIMLRYYLELSEAEIAETLGIARGSVKSHAHRGLKRLRSVLAIDGPIDLTADVETTNDEIIGDEISSDSVGHASATSESTGDMAMGESS